MYNLLDTEDEFELEEPSFTFLFSAELPRSAFGSSRHSAAANSCGFVVAGALPPEDPTFPLPLNS